MNFEMAADMLAVNGVPVQLSIVADDIASALPAEKHRRRIIECTRMMGVALRPCTISAMGKPNLIIGENEMALGMGIHGEPGIERTLLKTANEVAVFINGLGATPPEELYILYSQCRNILTGHGLNIYKTYVGEYATSMEMAGASLSLLKLDDEPKPLLDAFAFSHSCLNGANYEWQ